MNAITSAARPAAAADKAVVLAVRNLESYYGPIMAIRGCRCARARSSRCSAPTARARRR